MDEKGADEGAVAASQLPTECVSNNPSPSSNPNPTNDSTSPTDANTTVTPEDLIELVRAIKFKNPEASMRETHTEITTKMSQTDNFEFLTNVELNDIKKIWKKAISGKSLPNDSAVGSSSKNEVSSVQKSKIPPVDTKDDKNLITDGSKGGIVKFYTVGNGSIQTLAKNYTLEAAALAAAEIEQKDDEDKTEYIHCFLNVPADRSGKRPHQALINFNDNRKNKVSGKKKKANKKTKGTETGGDDGREIVKVQMAAPIPGHDEQFPFLLYNVDRSMRTFIHPDDDGGYDRIKKIMLSEGVSGAIAGGGSKAYFYGRLTRRKSHEQDIISIDVSSGLAPLQSW